ncbi:hypothetical protein [Nannocystis exedens]|nr:hypothetical protein [Nannocystis exedens]
MGRLGDGTRADRAASTRTPASAARAIAARVDTTCAIGQAKHSLPIRRRRRVRPSHPEIVAAGTSSLLAVGAPSACAAEASASRVAPSACHHGPHAWDVVTTARAIPQP